MFLVFSKTDLPWREGRRRRDTTAEVESSKAPRLPRAPFPKLYRVLRTQKRPTRANSQFKQVPADFCIYRTERIVQEVDVCVLIHRSRKQKTTSDGGTPRLPGAHLPVVTAFSNSGRVHSEGQWNNVALAPRHAAGGLGSATPGSSARSTCNQTVGTLRG